MKIENKHTVRCSLSMLAILLLGMVGCSEGDGRFPSGEGHKLVLRASSEQLAGEVSFSDTVFFAKGGVSGKYTEIWKACVKADGSASLSEPKYYPSDDSRIYLCGFAPEGTPDDAGGRKYSLDGRQDILVSNEQNGSLTDMFWQEGKSFEFVHLLSQLRFRLCCDAEGEGKGWTLLSLRVEGIQRDAVLSLADKNLSFSGEKGIVTVLDRTEEGEKLPLATDWSDIEEATLIQPGVGVSLTIMLADAGGNPVCFEHLPVTFHEDDNLPVAGTSYLLSVRLRSEDEASLSVAVAPWKTGAPGNGTITE